MAVELKSTELDATVQEAIWTIECALADSGYTGFFDIEGGNAHVDCFYFNGELHVQEGNRWFVRKDVR